MGPFVASFLLCPLGSVDNQVSGVARSHLISRQERTAPCSDLHKPDLTPLERKYAASPFFSYWGDMDKIIQFGVAKSWAKP